VCERWDASPRVSVLNQDANQGAACQQCHTAMVTMTIAFVVGIGVFPLIWQIVKRNTAQAFGRQAAMTFTPPDFRPALNANGTLQFDAAGSRMQVPTGEFVSFEPRHERYTKIAEVVTTLASASLIFIPNSRLNVYPRSCAFVLVLLGFSVLYCVGFMAMLTYYYEGFLYERNSYSPSRYGVVHALGFGGLICFALAYIWLAARVAWGVIYAAGNSSNPFR